MSDGRAHAILGASSAERWMNCSASVALIAAYYASGGKPNNSRYAQEGTAAHNLGELALRLDVAPEFFLGQFMTVLGQLLEAEPDDWEDNEANPYFEIDDDMVDAVTTYTAAIAQINNELLVEFGMEPTHFLEAQFSLEKLYPGLFGTNDYSMLVVGRKLVVIDYKHGRGKVVEVRDNPQLLYYALGAIFKVCVTKADLPETIDIIIVQPRAAHRDGPVRKDTYTLAQLQGFAKELVAKAKKTEIPGQKPVPGSWCQFCNANGTTCMAPAEKAMELLEMSFEDLTEEETGLVPTAGQLIEKAAYKVGGLAEALKLVPILDGFARGLEAYAQHELENGRHIVDRDGIRTHKLVRRRSNRRWKREAEATIRQRVKDGVISREEAFTEKMKSPAQLEKTALGKKMVATISEKPPGGITLAFIDDARDEVVMNPFEDLTEDDLMIEGTVVGQLALPAPAEEDWDIL